MYTCTSAGDGSKLRAHSAPAPGTTLDGAFVNMQSIDPASLGMADTNSIFPIPEETSATLQEIAMGYPGAAGAAWPTSPMASSPAWPTSPDRMTDFANSTGRSAASSRFVKPKDVDQHHEALMAAAAAQEINLRRSAWSQRSMTIVA